MPADLLALLQGRRGHFRMESGYHSELWFNLDRLFDDPAHLQPFVDDLARRLARHRPDIICGPMTGGAKLAAMLASKLGLGSIPTERHETSATGLFPIRYLVPASERERIRGKRIALVDDAISAGSAVKGTHADLLACDAKPVVFGALIIFGHAADTFATEKGLPLEAVSRQTFNLWSPDACPLCRAGVPLETISDSP